MSKRVVQYSGGVASWYAAKRCIELHGVDNVELLFADTLIEDEDLYRFIDETVAEMGCKYTRIAEGRTPWEVFNDVRFLGNSRIDPCSKILKRDFCKKWMRENRPYAVVVFGIMDDEEKRIPRIKQGWNEWLCEFPLCKPPFVSKEDIFDELDRIGIKPPHLYQYGFKHNNCGGFCVKSGQEQFKLLFETMPQRYREHEENENRFREMIEKDVSILRNRKGGQVKPFPLTQFREAIEKDKCYQPDLFGDEGCNCMY